jgi:predicted nucleic acid-binding protein
VRLLLDTNTVLSGMLWGGLPGRLIGMATAFGGQVDAIVSGDAHLLNLKSFRGIDIRTAAVALQAMD